MIDTSIIFDFLKYCLGAKGDMSRVVAAMDWRLLYEFASKQTMLGVCFDGIERQGKEYSEELKKNPIERDLLITWMGKGTTDSPAKHEGEYGAIIPSPYPGDSGIAN